MVSEADRTRWARLQEAFEAALDVPAGERAAHLAVADAELRTDVEALLEAHARDGGLDAISSALAPDERGPVPPEPSVPAAFGPWEVIRTVASGGMGSVHLVRRADDRGTWALKVLRADAASDSLRRRFLVERQILERLAHPGIARLVDDGIGPDGLPWLVMEYVDGTPIDAHCDRAGLAVVERLRLFLAVCDAVEHAHGVGVVHRDLKPDNILVTAAGEAKLLDFGIAKIIGGARWAAPGFQTTKGVRVFTLEHASPEQILGGEITPASDVYQLGLLLHHLLVGSVPALIQRIAGGASAAGARPVEPPSATARAASTETAARRGLRSGAELARLLRRGLDTVVVRALAEDPADRYRTVAELAAAVRAAYPAVAASSAAPATDGPLLDASRAPPRFTASGGGAPPGEAPQPRKVMKRILGMGVGVVYVGIAFGAFMRARAGWAEGHTDVGFWWTVVAALLGIAAVGAVVGTWLHTQKHAS